MTKTLIISFRYNPGHFSHLVANYKLALDAGLEPILYINPGFNGMDTASEYLKIGRISELPAGSVVKSAVIWFPSIRNIIEIVRFRFRYKTQIIYVYHEPFESVSGYLKSGFSATKVLKICLIHIVNLFVIMLSKHIVLPSVKANEIYAAKYRWLNRHYSMIPLLFDDEVAIGGIDQNKTNISYIGTIAADHAFDKFVSFIEAAIRQRWISEYNFIIATASSIPATLAEIVQELQQTGRLRVVQGRPLSTDEINKYYNSSLVVWNAYNRSMQSGVLPKAYMFGASVVSARSSATEYVDDYVTGRIVASNGDILEIKAAIEDIIANCMAYSKASRLKFMTTFYYKNSLDKFSALLR